MIPGIFKHALPHIIGRYCERDVLTRPGELFDLTKGENVNSKYQYI